MSNEPLLQAQAEPTNGVRPWANHMRDDRFLSRVESLKQLIANKDRRPHAYVAADIQQAAIASTDFPYLLGAVIERVLINDFADFPQTIEALFQKGSRINLNKKNAMRLDGADTELAEIPENGTFPATSVKETEYEYGLKVYGRQMGLSLQMLLNDDLGAFMSIPTKMARGARRTRQKAMTSTFWTTNGAIAGLFDTTGGQTAVATAALDAAGLAAALTAMSKYTLNSMPIVAPPKYLVVNPSLAKTAFELTQASSLATIATGLASTSSKTTEQFAANVNFIRNYGLTVIVDPWIPIVCSSGTYGATAWGLFCDPMDVAAAEFGTLRGYESPLVFAKTSNRVLVGGGADPFNGSFETGGRDYEVQDIWGSVAMAPQARYLSNGQ